jgi:dTMP kinase
MSHLKKGYFIVIDGTDGSGKKTQTELLVKRLQQEGYPVLSVSFPRYGTPSAKNVELYLAGELGEDPNSIDPYIVSKYYANDRLAHSAEIRNALNNGIIVISDRYVTANMGHQGSKFTNNPDRDAYLHWLYKLEYDENKIPVPDVNFILHVPTVVSQNLVSKRGQKKDIHENNHEHLLRAEQTYLKLPELFKKMILIECCQDGKLMTTEQIHEILWERITLLLN